VEALLLAVVDDGDTVGDEGEGESGEDALRIDGGVGESRKIVVLHESSKDVGVLWNTRAKRKNEVSDGLSKMGLGEQRREESQKEERTGKVLFTPVIALTSDEMFEGPGSWKASIIPK